MKSTSSVLLYPAWLAAALVSLSILATTPAAFASTEAEEIPPAFPSKTEIEILVDGAENITVMVSVTFPDSGYEVTDWGKVVRAFNGYYVSIEAVRVHEVVLPMETTHTHEYSFGVGTLGEYFFEVRSHGEQLAKDTFVIGEEDMPPAFPVIKAIEIHQDDTPEVKATVTLTLPDTSYMMIDWGSVQRDGNRVYVSVKAIKASEWGFAMLLTFSPEYVFGLPDPGEYSFEVWSHGQLLGTQSFVVEIAEPPAEFPARARVEILRDEALGVIAEVTVTFYESGWVVRDWGKVLRQGDPVRGHLWLISATIDRLEDVEMESLSADRRQLVDSSHRYLLGNIQEAGEHYLQFFLNDFELTRDVFIIGEEAPDGENLDAIEHPLPHLRSFEILREDGELTGRLGVLLGNSNEVIAEWGELRKNGRHLWVDIQAEYAADVGATVIRTEYYDYPIGELPPGDYTFSLYSRGQFIGAVRHSEPQPGGPTIELTIRNEEGDYFADLAFDPGESGWSIEQWSRLRLATHTFSASVEIDESAEYNAIQRHSYRLGALHPGDYRFAILGSGDFSSHHSFRIGEAGTTIDPFEQWQRARQAVAGGEAEGGLLEYAFGLDPNEELVNPIRISRRTGGDGDTWLVIEYRQPGTAADVIYRVEASSDLLEWTDITSAAWVRQTSLAPDGTPVRELESPAGDHPYRFLRVRALRSPIGSP